MTTATHPYFISREYDEGWYTQRFEHYWQYKAAYLEWIYSIPGYFSDRPITRIPKGYIAKYGIVPDPPQPVRTITETFSPSRNEYVYSNTAPKGSFVKIKHLHKNTDLMIVQGNCLRADAGTEIPIYIYSLLDVDFRTGQGEMIIIKEPNP